MIFWTSVSDHLIEVRLITGLTVKTEKFVVMSVILYDPDK